MTSSLPSFPLLAPRFTILALTACQLCLSDLETARAATISPGDVTAQLGPTFFVDDAVIGGGDVTVTQPAVVAYNRRFAGLLNANQGLSRVTLTGFGFATSTAAAENTATSLTVTFTYLGADEQVDGGDDVLMGSASGSYAYSSAAPSEYVFTFDAPITASLNITGTRFQIQVAPSNGTNNGKVRFKTDPLTYETSSGPKFSVAGVVAPQRLNLAKFQTVTTDSVSTSVKGQRLASYVTDGVAGNDNRWESGGSAPHWAQVTFPFAVEVGGAQVFSGVDDGGAMTEFKLQYFNGASWLDVPGAAVTGNTNVERNLIFTSPVTATAFRIYNSVDAAISIRELALYPPTGVSGYALGTDLTLNLAQQRPALATANTAGNFALLAVDGRVNKDSMWQTSTVGVQSLEIDLRVSTRIGSAHLYSGSPGVAALPAFVLSYWDGLAWLPIPGGSVTGNTSAALVIPFSSGITTTKVRLEFTNAGTTSVQELCIFPANTGNTGYPLGTGVIGAAPSTAKYDDYNDAYYNLSNPTAGRFIAVSNSGTPGLSQPGLTTAQGQYQILLNHGTGTYRLHNRATGNCLSGAELATTPGALLVDAPYSALPDQDWILDPIDTTNFYLINQWSGLVIDSQGGTTAAGTPLVQNVNTGAISQRWQMVASAHFPKKGGGGTNFANALNSSWAYNWGQKSSTILPTGAVYHPMQWGNFNWDIDSNAGPLWQYFPTWRTKGDGMHLLGFNEPDQAGQANFTVETGIRLWPRLLSLDAPLVSPAPASQDGGWLASFYTQANSLGYRVDYTAVHHYPGPSGGSATNLINALQSANTTWGRPVWLTEFSFVNWSGTNTWTEEDNYNCLAEFLWRAEVLTWLRKYGLFRFKEDAGNPAPANPWSPVGPRSNAHDANDKLTPFGELYAAWDGDATVKPNKAYHIHNKGTRKRLANTLASTADAKSIRINDTSAQWTLVPKPATSLYYIASTRDGRRLSYVNAGSVNLVAAGTIGTAVEWSLTEDVHGWFYLGHPATSKRLQLAYDNATSTATYTMAGGATTGNALLWRFIVTPPGDSWTGASGNSWTTAGSWSTSSVPITGGAVTFNSTSTVNLATVLNQDFNLWGITVTDPTGPVSIGGPYTLSLGGGGINLSAASQNLTITAPIFVGALQNWNIAADRTLSLSGVVSSNSDINLSGAGKVSLGAANVLPNGAGGGNLILSGTLDLNGTSQAINGLSGSGIVDNLTGGAGALTVGNNNATSTFDGILQNTSGTLALVKTGGGNFTLTGTNTHSGGTTINGAGGIFPKTDTAFGSGPVVMNGGTLYATGRFYTFANALTLNGGTLRVGGSNSYTVDWTGPVSVTADSGISSDGGTSGVTISGNVDMQGAILTNSGSVQNNLSGIVSGTGTIRATSGFLNFAAANTFSGTLRATSGQLKISHADGFKFATLDMNAEDTGTVNLNSLGANIGALTGSRNLGLGSSGRTVSIGFNGAGTTYSGVLSNGASFQKVGGGSLTLSGASTCSGTIVIDQGRLIAGTDAPSGAAGALGNSTGDVLLGTSGSGSFARILTNGAFTIGRNIRLRTGNNTDNGTRVLYIGSETAHNSVFSGDIILGSASNTSKGVSLTAAAGGQVTISGVIQDPTGQDVLEAAAAAALISVSKIGDGTVVLTNTNTYAGRTSVSAGTLKLGANNALPDATAVSIGTAALDASTFTDTVGTLDVTTLSSQINLGSGAALAFANSSAVSWTGGKLNITGTFAPGISLKFGSDATGLTVTQLGLISAPGFTSFSLTPTGYLTANGITVGGYDTWKTQITNGQNLPGDDADGDGFTNLHEFLFGTSPIAGNGSLVAVTASGGNLVLRWLQRESGATYTLKQSAILTGGSWTTALQIPALDGNQTGAPTDYDYHVVTLPTSGGKLFYRIEGVEN